MADLNFLRSTILELCEPYKDILTLKVGASEYSFYDQFNNHYKGRLLKYHRREDCERSTIIEFARIFYDSTDILDKLAKYAEFKEKLTDLENWTDIETNTLIDYVDTVQSDNSNSVGFGTGTLKDKSKTTIVNSDNNSYSSPKQIPEGEEIPQENLGEVIDYSLPLNQYQKNLLDDENKTETLSASAAKKDLNNKRLNIHKDKKDTTNTAKDIYDFMSKELPLLRLKFLNRFKPLFIWRPF